MTLTGAEPILPSSFAVGTAAQATVAAWMQGVNLLAPGESLTSDRVIGEIGPAVMTGDATPRAVKPKKPSARNFLISP